MKRVDWLDTLRVLASLIIIISHYVVIVHNVPSVQSFIYKFFGNTGTIGNMLFFALSGYLVANSLERSKNIGEFYRRKIIRLTIPFMASYLILATLLIFLGMLLDPEISNQSPFKNVINNGGSYIGVLIGMLPLSMDLYFVALSKLPVYSFVGEWFIGTIIYLYLISPLLYKCLRWNFIFAVISSFAIAAATFYLTLGLKDTGYIAENSVLFTVRIPEFLIGMILFKYRDFISRNQEKLNRIFLTLAIFLIFYGVKFNSTLESFWDRIILGEPINFLQYLIADVILVYLIFELVLYLNKNFTAAMTKFNSFYDISYVAMLIQHVVIYRFALSYDFSTLSKFGVLFFLLMITLTTIFLSKLILKICEPLEKRLIERRLFFG